jgi:hypothetical protein
VYPTAIGELAANSRLCPFPGKWITGLGFLAIPRAALLALADDSPAFEWRAGQMAWAFCESKVHYLGDGEQQRTMWIGEDYCLCLRLGGVDLLPIAVGHLKTVPLTADEETLRRIREGEPVGGDDALPVPFRVTTGSGSGLTVEQPERQKHGQGTVDQIDH